MDSVANLIFYCCTFVIVYTWLGYPLLLWLASCLLYLKRWRSHNGNLGQPKEFPTVTLLVSVHNEEKNLSQKIENSMRLVFPRHKLQIVVASDGSTDKTVAVARRLAENYDNIFVHERSERVGKTRTQNSAVERSEGEVIVFTDADTLLDPHCLKEIVKPFADPKVGCVAGRLIWTNSKESAVAHGGNLYWRYENLLWHLESQLGILAWAGGPCMAVRRDLFKPMEPQYGEDCVVPLDVIAQGYKVVFQPDAIAYEERIADPKAEIRVRARMTLRSFTGTLSRKQLLNPFRYPGNAWAIMSHKILRWLTPCFLLAALVANLFLLSQPFYRFTLMAQVSFYLVGFIGYFADRWHLDIPVVSGVYSFCLANAGMFWGVIQAALGYQIVAYRSEG